MPEAKQMRRTCLIPRGSSRVRWLMFLDADCRITSSRVRLISLGIDFVNAAQGRTQTHLQGEMPSQAWQQGEASTTTF